MEHGSGVRRGVGGVNVFALLATPKPVRISVQSDMSRDDVLDRLARAIGDFYPTDVQSPRYLGLGGTVASGQVTLTVKPYTSPGEREVRGMIPLVLLGQVIPTADGGEIQGNVTAPVGPAMPILMAFALLAWVLAGVSSGPATGVFAVTGAAFVAIAWTWIIRHNQRSALDRVDVLVRFLESIVVSSETPPAERLGGRGSRNSGPSGRVPPR